MSRVSICIPAYRNPDGIKRLLSSIVSQTYQDYEVVISDDTPEQDKTIDKMIDLESFGIKNIRYQIHEHHEGAASNWNKALDMATGDYIKIMHHDDWFTFSDSLSSLVLLLDENSSAQMAFCGTRQVKTGSTTEIYDRHTPEADTTRFRNDYRKIFTGNTIGAPSAVICRKSDIRYDAELTWLVDMEYYMDILSKVPEFEYTNEPLISIGMSEGQLTSSCIDDKKLNLKEYRYIYNKYNLREDPECMDKMLNVIVDCRGTRKDAIDCGITAEAYNMANKKKKQQEREFYHQLIMKKLGLR